MTSTSTDTDQDWNEDDAPTGVPSVPNWAKEGTTEDEQDIATPAVGKAKAMGPREDYIPAAHGIRMNITKLIIEERGPKGGQWKTKTLTAWLQVADGIVYGKPGAPGRNAKPGEAGQFKGKVFFHRIGCAINGKFVANKKGEIVGIEATGVDANGTLYDYMSNAKGNPSTYYLPAGSFWGELNEFLTATGQPTDGTWRNNKASRDAMTGMSVVYDIEKEPKESYDKNTKKRSRIPGEFENKLYNAKAATGGLGGASKGQQAAPAATIPDGANAGDAPWGKED